MTKLSNATLLVAGVAALVGPLAVPGAAHAEPQVIEVDRHRLLRVTSQRAAEVTGAYAMSDGRIMTLTHRGYRLVAKFDNGASHELWADGSAPMHFRSIDDRLRLRFAPGPGGPWSNVTASLPLSAAQSAELSMRP